MSASGAVATAPMPVGARYSPNTSRSAPAHSPTVPPARANVIVAGMRLSVDAAVSRSRSSAGAGRVVVPLLTPTAQRLELIGLGRRVGDEERRLSLERVDERRRRGLGEAVDTDDLELTALDLAHTLPRGSARVDP